MSDRHDPRPTKRRMLPCPWCGSSSLSRSRRRGLERMLGWVGLFPYRCDACTRRIYRFRPDPTRLPPRATGRTHNPPPR
jgi:hypothetical protein